MNDEELLDASVSRLGEFFDTVQIFVTKHLPDQDVTYKYQSGCGNMLARMYQVETWLGEQEFTSEDENDD